MPPDATRPIALKPFVDCVDQAAQSAPKFEAFSTFVNELHLSYSLLHDSDWSSERGSAMETAIHAALRGLWEGPSASDSRFTADEQDQIKRFFPRTARALQAPNWAIAPSVLVDPKLELLKAGLASLSEFDSNRSPRGGALCQKLDRLRSKIQYLGSLWQDQVDLSRLPKIASNEGETTMKLLQREYSRNLESASAELGALETQKSPPDEFSCQ